MRYEDLAYTKPYLMSLRPDREMDVAVLARCEAAGMAVEYGPTPALGKRTQAARHQITGLRGPAGPDGYARAMEDNPPLQVTQFIARLDDLCPGQRVWYKVILTGASGGAAEGAVCDFRTAPEAGGGYTFALMSDLQSFKPCDNTVRQIGAHRPDFILYSGDMANRSWRAADWFALPGVDTEPERAGMAFFDVMSQEAGGARLLPYAPIFPCPGNHEADDQRVEGLKDWAVDRSKYTMSIYCQLMRTYYPDPDDGWDGTHWYSLDYADMHIVSLEVIRQVAWNMYEAPGAILRADIGPGSKQARWLEADLAACGKPHTWVIMHWHMMNRGDDTQPYLCQPEPDPDHPGRVVYPYDTVGRYLHPLFVREHVSAVSYGHSHVYERYRIDGVHYIEAAYMGVKYGVPDGKVNPSGILPVNQQHDFRSYMIVRRAAGPDGRLEATAYQASVEPNGYGYEGRVFDRFDIE